MGNINFIDDSLIFNGDYKNKIKNKNRTKISIAVLSSVAISISAFGFVSLHWDSLNDFNQVFFQRDTTQVDNRSDVQSELLETNTVSEKNEVTSVNNVDISDKNGSQNNDVSSTMPKDINDNLIETEISNPPNIILSQERVRFKPDEAVFIEPEKANAVLLEYANNLHEYINSYNVDVKIYVVGTVAETLGHGLQSEKTLQRLSEKRSLTVLNALIEYGVPEECIAGFGMSYKDPWHLKNFDKNNNYLKDNAATNRKVVIVTPDDDTMPMLKEQIVSNGETLTMFSYKNGVLVMQEFNNLDF